MVRARWRARSGVLAAVCLGHVGLILLLTNTSSGYRQRGGGVGAMDQEPMLLVLIDELLREREPVDADMGVSNSARPALDVPASPASLSDFDIVEPITLPDEGSARDWTWSAEAKRSATGAVESQIARDALVAQSAREARGASEGHGVAAAGDQREHRLGDTEHYEGGETITWINSRCYYSTLCATWGRARGSCRS